MTVRPAPPPHGGDRPDIRGGDYKGGGGYSRYEFFLYQMCSVLPLRPQTHTKSSAQAAEELLRDLPAVLDGVEDWQRAVLHNDLPEWLQDFLVNSPYTFARTGMWWQSGAWRCVWAWAPLREGPAAPLLCSRVVALKAQPDSTIRTRRRGGGCQWVAKTPICPSVRAVG